MSIGAIIFSRIDSKRLPAKALIDIEGKLLLEMVIERCKKITGIDKIIVATTYRSIDDDIESLSIKKNVLVFRGSVNNVLLRAINTCKKYKLTKFVRVCGDRPFFDPFLVSKLIKDHNLNNYDIITTMFPRTLPPGLTVEIINFSSLKKVFELSKDSDEMEHITKYFYQNPDFFSILNHEEKKYKNIQNLSFVVDNNNDLIRTKWVVNKIKQNNLSLFDMENIISFSKEWFEKHN